MNAMDLLRLYLLLREVERAIKRAEARVEKREADMTLTVYFGTEKALEARFYDKELWELVVKYVFI